MKIQSMAYQLYRLALTDIRIRKCMLFDKNYQLSMSSAAQSVINAVRGNSTIAMFPQSV